MSKKNNPSDYLVMRFFLAYLKKRWRLIPKASPEEVQLNFKKSIPVANGSWIDVKTRENTQCIDFCLDLLD